MNSYDDIFKTDENRAEEELEKIQEIPTDQLHPFKDHPFKVLQNEEMDELVESIKQYGILTPLVVRPMPDGDYEIVAGHRRHFAAQLAGVEELPVVVKNLSDDAAVLWMVDSNLQRENILPSERAYAYKMKMDALSHQGQRTDLTCTQVEHKLNNSKSVEQLASDVGSSRSQVQRYIRLTNLNPEVLDMVDAGKISFTPAVELSYLKPEEQKIFVEAYDYAQSSPSLSQAQRLRKMSQKGNFTLDAACDVMSEVKKGDLERVTFKNEEIRKYFPKSYTTKQMQDTIIKLLEQWQKKREKNQER